MPDEIVLKRSDATALLRGNRRRVMMAETDVAISKLVFEARSDEFHTICEARQAMESRYPWLMNALEEIPDDLAQKDPESNREAPYVGIMKRYELLCNRGDRVSDQLFTAPHALQSAINKQAEFEIKSGQMVSGPSVLAMILELVGAAGQAIESQSRKDWFMREAARIRRDFIDANPHLISGSTGG